MLVRTPMSHDDGQSLCSSKQKPDVRPSPARAPSVSRISRLSHEELFLAKNLVTILKTVRAFEVSKQGSGKKNSSLKYRPAPRG